MFPTIVDGAIQETIDGVIGPIEYTQQIPHSFLSFFCGKNVLFALKTSTIPKTESEINALTVLGSGVYHPSSIQGILYHIGAVELRSKPREVPFLCFNVVRSFNKVWKPGESYRRQVDLKVPEYVFILIHVTQQLSRFEASKEYTLKSKPYARGMHHGLAVISADFGSPLQPPFPQDTRFYSAMSIPKFESSTHEGPWMLIGPGNNALLEYSAEYFNDYGKDETMLFGTLINKYFLILLINGEYYMLKRHGFGNQLFDFVKVPKNTVFTNKKKLNRTEKEVIAENLRGSEIAWKEDSVVIRGQVFGSIAGVRWFLGSQK